MEASIEKYIDRLIGILSKKKGLLEDILSLTEAQTNAISEDSIDVLDNLIDHKQLKIYDINKLDEEFEVYFSRLKSTQRISSLNELDMTAIAGAKELKAITAEIVQIISNISSLEKQNSKKSNELLGQLGGEIKKINQNIKVNNVYSPNQAKAPSYFIDKKK